MKRHPSIVESRWIEQMNAALLSPGFDPEPEPGELIRLIRTYLRMPQDELAQRAKITQPHLAAMEAGRVDPQWGTLKRVFKAMRIGLGIQPLLDQPLKELLRARARSLMIKRLKQTMGTMALEKQAPDAEKFRELLEKRIDEFLEQRERFRLDND